MSLKTSLFDKSVIKSDFKRFWWVSALFMLLLALFVLPGAVNNTAYPESFADSFYFRTDEGFLSFAFAFGLGGLLFSYLHKGNSASCLHGLPVTRRTQYLSHILAGFVLLIIPIIISSVVIFIECVCLNSGEIFALRYAFKYFYTCSVYAVMTLLVTVFAAMLSGNTIATYVFTVGFIVLPFAIETMSNYILEANLYGFAPSDYTAISEKLYIYGIDKMCSSKSIVYIVIIVVLLFVNMWLYKIRNIESYEEIIAFKPLRPVFMYAVAVFFGFFGWTMLNSMFQFNNLFLGTMPLGIVALIAAFMLNRKSFGIKGLFKPIIIFVVGVGILQLCFMVDITGYERRVPDISQVESVEPYNDVWSYGYSTEKVDNVEYDDVKYRGTLSDEKDIDNILKLHQAIVDNRKLDKSDFEGTRVTIKYNLNNGKELERSYTIDDNLYMDYMKGYYENEAFKKVRFPFINDSKKEINYVIYQGIDVKESLRLQYIDYDKLEEAIKKDVMALNAEDVKKLSYGDGCGRSITVNYNEIIEHEGKELKYNISLDFDIKRYFKNTLNIINEYLESHKESIIDVKRIDRLEVNIYNVPVDENGNKLIVDQSISIDDKNDIKELYNAMLELRDSVPESRNDVVNMSIGVFCGNNQEAYGYFGISYNEIPEVLAKYLK